MKKKTLNYVTDFFQKNKHSKKFWLFFIFNLLSYLIAFPLGLFISFLWWFFKSSKVNKKIKKVIVFSFLAFIFSISGYITWGYNKDPEPTLEVWDLENNQTIQSSNINISGIYTPSDFNIYINDEKIDSSDGNFNYNYSLKVGENKIIIKVLNFKSIREEIIIIRELSPEEIVRQEAEKKKIEEELKLAEEEKQQAEEIAQQEAKEEAEKKRIEKEEKEKLEAENQRLKKEADEASALAEKNRIEEEQRKAEEAIAEEERIDKIESQFSPWDGSHIKLTRFIKDLMNDPKSYEHDKTVYIELENSLIVTTTFRGRNAYGGMVKTTIMAEVSLDGEIIEIISQE